MSSNNPFASAMNGEYKHHRDPPKPPQPNHKPVPPHPPRDTKPAPPPSYAEVAGSSTKDYPREKASSSSSSSSRPHRSHSDSARRHETSHSRLGKSSSKRKSSKKKVEPHKPGNLDTIDKLDVSAFFGGRFHHDGPFDACTPHRNKVGKNAPVLAFPVDGPNSTMKAVGPGVNNNDRMNLAFGNYSEEDHNEIVGSRSVPTASRLPAPMPKTNRTVGDPQHAMYTPSLNPSVVAFDANVKAAPIHGLTTAGLGSSTFVDGAPAPRGDEYLSVLSGLGRKKSLVQRLRKNSLGEPGARRLSHDTSDYQRPAAFEDESGGNSLLRRVKSLKVGRK